MEEAGIAKPGMPFVVGERDPALIESATARGPPGGGARRAPGRRPTFGLLPPEYEWNGPARAGGPHQRQQRRQRARYPDGAASALSATEPRGDRPAGFASAAFPGTVGPSRQWLFDVAHNPDGDARPDRRRPPRSSSAATAAPRPVSILGDKAWPEMLVRLDKGVRPRRTHHRAERGGPWLGHRVAAPLAPNQFAPAGSARTWTLVPEFGQALGSGAVEASRHDPFHSVGDGLPRRDGRST